MGPGGINTGEPRLSNPKIGTWRESEVEIGTLITDWRDRSKKENCF